MKQLHYGRPTARRAWRVFGARDGRRIEIAARRGLSPLCPCCGEILEAEGTSRLSARLPLDARAYDLTCRACRRFWSVVQHTERSLRLVRMRRFVAALRAVEREEARPAPDAVILA